MLDDVFVCIYHCTKVRYDIKSMLHINVQYLNTMTIKNKEFYRLVFLMIISLVIDNDVYRKQIEV